MSDFSVEKYKTLVVVPAWNEAPSIGSVIKDIQAQGLEVLVVDDGSSDGTAAVARAAGALVISLPFNLGVGAALRCGFRYADKAGYTVVIQCDADGQHPVEYILVLVQQLIDSDAHMVIGSRFAQGGIGTMKVSVVRRLAMRILSFSASRATGACITDSTSGFRAIRQPLLGELAQQISPYYLGDTYEAIISAGQAGYRIDEVYAPITERTHGLSSASPMKAARLAVKAVISAILNFNPRLEGPNQVSIE